MLNSTKTQRAFVGLICLGLSAGLLSACAQEDEAVTDRICKPQTGATSIAAVTVQLGAQTLYPEEQSRRANLDAYTIDRTEVTNAQFRKFVSETGYVTTAEKPQAGADVPGGAVFRPPTARHPSWWQFVEGADWRHPDGPGSSIDGQDDYPVVQVSLEDALAYAAWAGRTVPTEDQWEHAAQAGAKTRFPWGDERTRNGRHQANAWQGAFPINDSAEDGFSGRAPVGCYGANAFGLYDMIGNVWEWTQTPFTVDRQTPAYMIKGGSYLCATSYCRRDRAASRQPQERDFSTNHIGFRTVSRPDD